MVGKVGLAKRSSSLVLSKGGPIMWSSKLDLYRRSIPKMAFQVLLRRMSFQARPTSTAEGHLAVAI